MQLLNWRPKAHVTAVEMENNRQQIKDLIRTNGKTKFGNSKGT